MLGGCLTSQPQKGSLSVKQQPEQKRSSETGRKRSTSEERKKKDRGGEPRSAARHTFLGSSRFRWWNRTTGKLCVCASAFMEFQKDKTKKQTKKPKRKHRGATFERSRTDTVDNEKASEEQFINDKPVSSDTRQWEQVEVKRLNHLQIALGVERRKQKQSVSSMLPGGFILLTTGTLWLVFSWHLRGNTISDWTVMVQMALVASQCARIHETWDSLWFCFNLGHLKPSQLQTRSHSRANVLTEWY